MRRLNPKHRQRLAALCALALAAAACSEPTAKTAASAADASTAGADAQLDGAVGSTDAGGDNDSEAADVADLADSATPDDARADGELGSDDVGEPSPDSADLADSGDGADDASTADSAADDAAATGDSAVAGDADTASGAPDAAEPPPKPPFPIVMAHGFFGFNDFAGAGFIDYFYKVKPALEKKGELLVFTPAVDPFESSEVRGAALWAHIQTILAQTGKQKVVLIGHSQGGLDARVIANQHPEAVAALVTVATPHGGSPVADAVLFVTPGPISKGIVEALGKLVGGVINPDSDNSLMAALGQLSTKQAEAFDKTYPLPTSIPVWSIAGRSLYAGKGGPCSSSNTPWFISKWNSETDPVNALLLAFTAAMVGKVNDGLVPVESAKRGTFLGCIPADHLDQIGHILGQPPGLFNDFDHKEFWLDLVQWVRAQGY